MNSKKKTISKTELEKEIDKLEEMWDAKLSRGDDDYYEATRHQRKDRGREEGVEKRPRRKGKRM